MALHRLLAFNPSALVVVATALLFASRVLAAPVAAPAAPDPTGPADGAVLAGLATAITWTSPPDATQFPLQVLPAVSPSSGQPDGPGIDLIIGDAAQVAAGMFSVPEPVFGAGPYLILPGMTYTWRVRVSNAISSIAADDPSWSAWSAVRSFRTRAASAGTVGLRAPAGGVQAAPRPTLQWGDTDPGVFYYEVQLSADPAFQIGPDAVAPVYFNLVHGAQSNPPRSWRVPAGFDLAPGAYSWRVRPRIQGDGAPVPWSPAAAFVVTVQPGHVVINEVQPVGDAASPPFVELTNTTGAPVALAGAVLSDEDGFTYTFPAALAQVPPHGFVVLYVDGKGAAADDYDFSDGLATLHTATATSPFEPAGDQVALYGSSSLQASSLIDYVAWGIPPTGQDANAVSTNLWPQGAFVNAQPGGDGEGLVPAGAAIGLIPGERRGLPRSWQFYPEGSTTPGQANGLPSTGVTIPPSGAETLRQDFTLAWYSVEGAAQYNLQMDNDAGFSSPAVDVTLAGSSYTPAVAPPDGRYFWRVRARNASGAFGPFNAPSTVEIVTAPPIVIPGVPTTGAGRSTVQEDYWDIRSVDMPVYLQHKDTDMLCWDGDDEAGPRQPWDHSHADTPGNHSAHGRNYCARASIAMVAAHYGSDLSQDRLSYQHFGAANGPFYGALGHDKPLPIAGGQALLSWALNDAPVALTMGKPSWEDLVRWASDDRPVLSGIPGHAIVLQGTAAYIGPEPTLANLHMVIWNDPWDAHVKYTRYESLAITNTRVPQGNPTGRKQEATVTRDTDGDGIVDFDETVRFGTNPNKRDTDGDCIPDKADMHSYLYRPHGAYAPVHSDFDGDGLRNDLDADSDGGGRIDGDEDENWNGHTDAGDRDAYGNAGDDVGARFVCSSPPPTPTPTPTPPRSNPPPSTPTPTGTPTPTATATETATPTATGSATSTPTVTPTATLTFTPTRTATPTVPPITSTPTATPPSTSPNFMDGVFLDVSATDSSHTTHYEVHFTNATLEAQRDQYQYNWAITFPPPVSDCSPKPLNVEPATRWRASWQHAGCEHSSVEIIQVQVRRGSQTATIQTGPTQAHQARP